MTPSLTVDAATSAYQTFAPFYDSYTQSYDHHRWLRNLEAVALDAGLSGHRLLDVACGTGKSFMPMLERGYEITACDLSPAMVEHARRRSGLEPTDVFVADMRDLPRLGSFDLATCLDDSLNYLLTDEELARAFTGIARNVRAGGFFIFDVNSLAVYETLFSQDATVETEEALFCWRGSGDADVEPGATCEATIEIFSRDHGDCWARRTSRHLQRHHEPALVEELLGAAGFELAGLYGQVTGARLEQPVEEDRHLKLVYLCRRAAEQPALVEGGG